jgi:hypothetical protein
MHKPLPIMLLTVSTFGCLLQTTGIAQQANFRIETDVMQADQAKPSLQSVTLFHDGVAYDFSRDTPHQVTIVDGAANRVVLIDSQRQIQSRVNLQELQSFMDQVRAEMASSSLAAALEDAKLVQVDSAAGLITVGRDSIAYLAKMQHPENPDMAQQYAVFANATAQLNAWQYPGQNPPAFARLHLNQAISQQAAIPSEITRTVTSGRGQKNVVRSRVHATWRLTPEDQQQVEQFTKMLLAYPSIEIGQYMNPAVPMKR